MKMPHFLTLWMWLMFPTELSGPIFIFYPVRHPQAHIGYSRKSQIVLWICIYTTALRLLTLSSVRVRHVQGGRWPGLSEIIFLPKILVVLHQGALIVDDELQSCVMNWWRNIRPGHSLLHPISLRWSPDFKDLQSTAFGFILAKLWWGLILFSLNIPAWLLRNLAMAAWGKWGICLPEVSKLLLLL